MKKRFLLFEIAIVMAIFVSWGVKSCGREDTIGAKNNDEVLEDSGVESEHTSYDSEKNNSDKVAKRKAAEKIANDYLKTCETVYNSDGSLSHRTSYDYDSQNRVVSESWEGPLIGSYTVINEYDSSGRLYRQSIQDDLYSYAEYTYPSTGGRERVDMEDGSVRQRIIENEKGQVVDTFWYFIDTNETLHTSYYYNEYGDERYSTSTRTRGDGSVVWQGEYENSNEYNDEGLLIKQKNLSNGDYDLYEYDDNYCVTKISSYSSENALDQLILWREFEYVKKGDKNEYSEGWAASYADILDSTAAQYELHEYNCSYNLYDINEDGIPELFINSGNNEADKTIEVYTYAESDNMVYQIASMAAGHAWIIPSEEKDKFIIIEGYGDIFAVQYSWEAGNMVAETLYEGPRPDNEDLVFLQSYKLNDKSGLTWKENPKSKNLSTIKKWGEKPESQSLDTYRVVKGEYIFLRKEPIINSETIGQINEGEEVSIVMYGLNGFWKGTWNGMTGYVLPSRLEPVGYVSYQEPRFSLTVTGSNAIMRCMPADGAEAMMSVPQGSVVNVYDVAENGYYLVAYMGQIGYLPFSKMLPDFDGEATLGDGHYSTNLDFVGIRPEQYDDSTQACIRSISREGGILKITASWFDENHNYVRARTDWFAIQSSTRLEYFGCPENVDFDTFWQIVEDYKDYEDGSAFYIDIENGRVTRVALMWATS